MGSSPEAVESLCALGLSHAGGSTYYATAAVRPGATIATPGAWPKA
jgi:hypothetical protein